MIALVRVLPDLVARAQRGDERAFEELHARFARSVHGILLARLGKDDADDAVQEVFLNAHRRLAELREAGAFGPWLHAIARNVATDRVRSLAARPRVVALRETESDELAAPGEGQSELRERVLHHVRSLPEAYRETLLLRLVEGLTGPEIAEQTGLTPGSVRVNLHRGMELLRPLLEREGWP